jgi:hypothetical protein
MAMHAPVHVENFGRLFGSNQPISAHFTAFNSSDQLQRKRSSIFQEALLSSTFLNLAPNILIDTRGSTPFNTNDFFLVEFISGASNIFMKSLTVDLTPVNAFFDSTNSPPGISSSPFAISLLDLVGITNSDITLTGGNTALNGQQTLTLTFADNTFKAGDSFRFGVDIDLVGKIDSFGATPEELIGSLFAFEFSDGYRVKTAVGDDLTASSTLPFGMPAIVGSPSGGPDLPNGTITDDPDPVPASVPAPGPLPILGALSGFGYSRTLIKRIRKAQAKSIHV